MQTHQAIEGDPSLDYSSSISIPSFTAAGTEEQQIGYAQLDPY